jgi:NADPH:quinone reductase-like Zn-dependent oxidoreductase
MGVIHSMGTGTGKFTVGQRVTGAPFSSIHGGSGTWQQYLVVKEDCLVAVPDSVSDSTAAQVGHVQKEMQLKPG